MGAVWELELSAAALLPCIHVVILRWLRAHAEPQSSVATKQSCIGNSLGFTTLLLQNLTHLFSLCRAVSSTPCPAFYATNWWAKPRIQRLGAVRKDLPSAGFLCFAFPF